MLNFRNILVIFLLKLNKKILTSYNLKLNNLL